MCLNTCFQFLNNITRILHTFSLTYFFKKTKNCYLNIQTKQALVSEKIKIKSHENMTLFCITYTHRKKSYFPIRK